MSPGMMFLVELLWLALFGWYFATDYGTRKRGLAFLLVAGALGMSILMIYPPEKKIQLGLDIKGGTSFLIKLQGTADKDVTPATLDQAVEVIRKRVDYFGASEPVISPVGKDRILVQIPGLSTEKIQEARQQLSQAAKLEFALVHPQNATLVPEIESGQGILPPEYRLVTYTFESRDHKKQDEKLLVHKRPDLTGTKKTTARAPF